MQNSSNFCRSQEAIQIKRAAETTLDNVRAIATKAAEVWRLEAVAAEQREDRHRQRLAVQSDDRLARETSDQGLVGGE
ncbi:hypothetical protein HL653_18865 [Sphingomonas sp. AP4-R1]|uniref:hypothetical protein n=1 Tax=Sphingomonas sp. AP4-R1 TaxID=2735134 RepID=UPI001493C27E|nr:hypothetical protein [Sphingomonas sp. AP4-R1]QJU59542.1 hypothetical protein HL653_18865 [Sphingomonas sp. AP4-R1]